MTSRRLSPLLGGAALAAAAALPAQSVPRPDAGSAARRAAETVTEAGVRDGVAVLADDSMRGRATPSPELELTAAYIADRFRGFGLEPGGDGGTYLQRYAIRRLQADSTSYLAATAGPVTRRWPLGHEAAVVYGRPPDGPMTAPVVLLGGVPADTARPFGDVALRGTIVMQVLHADQIGNRLVDLITRGVAEGVRAWIFISDRRAAEFALYARNTLRPQYQVGGQDPGPIPIALFEVRDSSAADVLRAAGVESAALLAPGAPALARAVPGLSATIDVRRRVVSEASAPNVIGVLPGRDPRLRNEYVFFTGHMDHLGVVRGGQGCRPAGADSICNGADDDASGAIGVGELAGAFSRLDPPPRRTLVFMTVSGEERGLWGSAYYVDHPRVPLAATVADLNLDMIGRNWRDTIAAIGKAQSSLGALADSVAGRHPELGLRVIDDIWPQEGFYYRSDHYNFARRGVPILFFTSGVHEDYHRATDAVAKIDAEKEARILRLVFYLGLAVADAPAPPAWDPESRRRVVTPGGP
jgi:hypothetical protein